MNPHGVRSRSVAVSADHPDTDKETLLQSFCFIVEPYLSGVRIDSFLARHFRNYTSWRLHRMACEGLVLVNGLPVDADQRVFRGQEVSIRLVEPPDKLLAPERMPLDIVWEDPWIVVINKPVGVVAHPVGEFQDETLSNSVQEHLDQQSQFRGLLRPGIVHRLDRMTSGLIVIAKEHLSHRLLSLDFQNGRAKKSYFALVEGCVGFASRTINLPIGVRAGSSNVLMSAKPDACSPRKARTDVRLCTQFSHCTLVECTLYTGRHHQIRVHMAEIGHPVVGDEFYAANGDIKPAPRLDGAAPTTHRHALHASKLAFWHPILKQELYFSSEPGPDFWELNPS